MTKKVIGNFPARFWNPVRLCRLETDAWSFEDDRTLHCTPKVSPAVAPLRHSSGTPGMEPGKPMSRLSARDWPWPWRCRPAIESNQATRSTGA